MESSIGFSMTELANLECGRVGIEGVHSHDITKGLSQGEGKLLVFLTLRLAIDFLAWLGQTKGFRVLTERILFIFVRCRVGSVFVG